MKTDYLKMVTETDGRKIRQVSTELRPVDYLGAMMVRWGIRRDKYRVSPGLYSVGTPDTRSDVFVTSNYKLSFDHLRKSLSGIDCWILVLDTKGVNVWCAAGKGVFSTDELVFRIQESNLGTLVEHRRIVVPQLGATGVSAFKVKEATGFNVKFGPVRAMDIKDYLLAGYKATVEMRKVEFNFYDRLKLIPNDFVQGKLVLFGSLAMVLILSVITKTGISFGLALKDGLTGMLIVLLAYISGIVITPAMLPVLPFRQFFLKGLTTGFLMWIILFLAGITGNSVLGNASWLLIISTISSFMAMNFTGSSTYTSLSGVKKEMKLALPLQITFAAAGIVLSLLGKFITF
jgi:hypothetical protein